MERSVINQSESPLGRPRTSQFGELIGRTPAMTELFALAAKVAPCDVTAFVTGETGTGKELLARAIHEHSPRASKPFVAFSCANLPDTLIDDELFGHEKGAFTGADRPRRGRFEAADGGTLFLDEIGDLPLALQARLLRVLQERRFERLGGTSTVSVDIRLVCATHRDLEAMVRAGTFRQDLLYRLNVMQFRMPPLRDRREDIAPLAEHFLERFGSKFNRPICGLSWDALRALTAYDWPGNVRQLENAVQRAVALAETLTVEVEQLPAEIRGAVNVQTESEISYDAEVRDFKRRLLMRSLQECRGNLTQTARLLKLARPYLHRLVGDLGLASSVDILREQGRLAAA